MPTTKMLLQKRRKKYEEREKMKVKGREMF